MDKRFQDLDGFTHSDAEAAIVRNDLSELPLASITVALLSEDINAAQAFCLRLCSHEHYKVRSHALISLGHLARRFRILDEQRVKPIIESALLDDNEYVRVHAKSAADEIHQFLGWKIKGHIYGA